MLKDAKANAHPNCLGKDPGAPKRELSLGDRSVPPTIQLRHCETTFPEDGPKGMTKEDNYRRIKLVCLTTRNYLCQIEVTDARGLFVFVSS